MYRDVVPFEVVVIVRPYHRRRVRKVWASDELEAMDKTESRYKGRIVRFESIKKLPRDDKDKT